MLFYLENEKWVPRKKKITETIQIITYTDNADGLPGVVEDVVLTDEQKERLAVIQSVNRVNAKEVEAYVMDGISTDYAKAEIEKYNLEKATDELIATLPTDSIEKNNGLILKIVKEWDGAGKFYKAGKPLKYNDVLYTVLQAHTSQPDWSPDKAVSLFSKVLTSPAGPLPWVQPDSTNAYKIGDKVLYKGVVWTSKINANVTIPDGDVPHNRYWTDK
ncbi:hypothetical protein DSECCO2_567370 [anaerobic digester metagenome]